MKTAKIARNATFNIFYNLVNVLFPLVIAVYVYKILMPAAVGKVAFISNVASYFVLIAPLGIQNYGMKMVGLRRGDSQLDTTYSELFLINTVSTMTVSLIYYSMVFIIPYFSQDRTLYLIAGIAIIANFINIDWLYRGLENYSIIAYRNLIGKIIFLICIFIFVRNQNDLPIYLFILSSISLINNLISVVQSRKVVKFDFSINIREIRKHYSPIFFLFVSLLASNIYLKMDITMLGLMGSDYDVGIYSTAIRISNIILIFITSITAVSLPMLSELYFRDDIKSLARLIKKLLNILLIISVPATIGLLVLSKDLVVILFGYEFVLSSDILRIFTLLFIVKGCGDLIAYQLVIATNQEKILPQVRFLSVLINGILNYVLILKFGIYGAAFATVITETITLTILFTKMRKIVPIQINKSTLCKVIASTVFMTVSFLITKNISNLVFRFALSSSLGFLVYFVSLLMLKENEIVEIFKKVKNRVLRKV